MFATSFHRKSSPTNTLPVFFRVPGAESETAIARSKVMRDCSMGHSTWKTRHSWGAQWLGGMSSDYHRWSNDDDQSPCLRSHFEWLFVGKSMEKKFSVPGNRQPSIKEDSPRVHVD